MALFSSVGQAQVKSPVLDYTLSIPQPSSGTFHVGLSVKKYDNDTLILKMPKWMPGYYQLMDYADNLSGIKASYKGNDIPVGKINGNTWYIANARNKDIIIDYDIKASRPFVATNFVDETRAYIVPAGSFLYIEGFLNAPVKVKINKGKWTGIATGLKAIPGTEDKYTAPDFDILYDCPILIGNLEKLPDFTVNGIKHHFIGYDLGDFDKESFVGKLEKAIQAAVDLMGEVPYDEYTFIGTGPGAGGIEHLNNTTIPFNGEHLTTREAMNNTLSFIVHEYFHNFNVKRIRPYELGPFDYDNKVRTNLLWVSEGLTVYYEYIILKKAGLINEEEFCSYMGGSINSIENDSGRRYQSLSQSSYSTWEDGPFGAGSKSSDETISYYVKGPVVGMLLDFAIRNATNNEKSLDDVMRLLYNKYYKQLQRGFTEVEVQVACESVAGCPLTEIFEYIYTTKDLDYTKYLGYAGLELDTVETISPRDNIKRNKLIIKPQENLNPLQARIL